MVTILYTFDRRFMRKTFAAIDRPVDAPSAYLPLRPAASGALPETRELAASIDDAADLDDAVFDVDPAVVVRNNRFETTVLERRPDYPDSYPVVHVRHGASVGRGERETTTDELGDAIDVALAPGRYWADHYRRELPGDVRVAVVGIPEADALVGTEAPRQRRVLYAPTNHTYGGGSYLSTATQMLDVVADSDFELRFRPHPMDRIEEPGRSLTAACRERITAMPNVSFDDGTTPEASMRWADVLVSDYSGIVTEWLHTGRPLLQVTDVEGGTVPTLGETTDALSLSLLDAVYHGDAEPSEESTALANRAALGIPMDGRAGERAAREVLACTQ
jgi:hypothetical protein